MITNRLSVVGIDLGNMDSIVAMAKSKKIEVLTSDTGKRKSPSVISFDGKERRMGASAKSGMINQSNNTFFSFTRLLGRRFDDPEIALEKKHLPYTLVQHSEELPGGGPRIGIEATYDNKTEVFTPEQVTAIMLRKLKSYAEREFSGQVIEDCVLSCPGWFTDVQKRALIAAAQIVELKPIQVMHENTAIALTYGLLRPQPATPKNVMFIDMGHTQTSVSVVKFWTDNLKVLGAVYDKNLGGRDFDEILFGKLAEITKDKYKLDVSTNKKATLKLRREANRLKHVLSANNSVNFNCEYLMNDTDVSGSLTRADFEGASQELLGRLKALVASALALTKVKLETLDSVEIVGGGIRVPMVQTAIKSIVKKDLQKTCDGDESVARGCALMCAMLSPSFQVKKFTVKDCNQYPVQLCYNSDKLLLFPASGSFPSTKEMTFKNSKEFSLGFRYDGNSTNAVPLPPQTPLDLGTGTVSGFEQLVSTDQPSKLKVRLRMDRNGFVSVSMAEFLERYLKEEEAPKEVKKEGEEAKAEEKKEEKKTEEPAKKKFKIRRHGCKIVNSAPNKVSDAVLKSWITREAQMEAEDELIRGQQMIRNDLESYVMEMNSLLQCGTLDSFINPDKKASVATIFEEGEYWFEDNFDAEYKVIEAKLKELREVGDGIKNMKKIAGDREEKLTELKNKLAHFQKAAEGPDVVDEASKEKLTKELEQTSKWLEGLQWQQSNLKPWDVPAFTAKVLQRKLDTLMFVCSKYIKKQEKKDAKSTAVEEDKKKAEAEAEAEPEEEEEMLAIE